MDAKAFAKECFSRYYASHAGGISVPGLSQREFGFGWQEKIDYRHKAFAGERDFYDFLRLEAPLYASYSTARYSLPAARPMPAKGFLGADLAFDLDKTYEGEHPEKHGKIVCGNCLERSKEDALRFYEDFLLADFGFAKPEVSVNFSGNKGFHFHVRSEAVQQLSSFARKELCDYAAALDVSSSNLLHEPLVGRAKSLAGPSAGSLGWQKAAFDHVTDFLQSADEAKLLARGVSRQKCERLLADKGNLVSALSRGNWDYLPGLKDFWASLVDEAIRLKRVELDKPVTFDRARLIRIPNTLHGTTSFIAKETQDLGKFNPLEDALAFGKELQEIVCFEDVRLELGGQLLEFPPDKLVSAPLPAALLLVLKGVAATPG